MEIRHSEIPRTDAFTTEAVLDERMSDIFSRWPDLVFPLPRGADWLLIPEDGFASAVWRNDEIVPAGRFVAGRWRGVLTSNPGPGKPDVNAVVAELRVAIEKLLAPVREWIDARERIRPREASEAGRVPYNKPSS